MKVVYKGSFGRKFEIKTRGSAFSVDLIDEITILCTRAPHSYTNYQHLHTTNYSNRLTLGLWSEHFITSALWIGGYNDPLISARSSYINNQVRFGKSDGLRV